MKDEESQFLLKILNLCIVLFKVFRLEWKKQPEG